MHSNSGALVLVATNSRQRLSKRAIQVQQLSCCCCCVVLCVLCYSSPFWKFIVLVVFVVSAPAGLR